MLKNIFLFAVLTTSLLQGQSPQRSVIALRADRLFDGKSSGLLQSGVILVEDGKISAIGTSVSIPPGAYVVDLGDSTLLPGIIDCHTHLLQNYDPKLPGVDELNMLQTVATMSTAKRALLGAAIARQDLEAGITTVRDVGNSGVNGDVALRDAIAAGWVEGSRMLVSTRALAPAGGQFGGLDTPAQGLIAQEYVVVSTVDEAHKAVSQAVYDGADLIKVIVNGSGPMLSPEVVKAIVEDAHRSHRKVAAHASGNDATRIAADAGVDSIEHAYTVPDDVLATMAAKHIFLVPTDGPEETYAEILRGSEPGTAAADVAQAAHQAFQRRADRLRRAIAKGVPVAAGSDMYWNIGAHARGQNSIAMLRAYAGEGLPPIEVIRAATSNAAELLGWQDRIGILEKGKYADVIAVPGNPLSDVNTFDHVLFVMKEGKIIRNDIKQTERKVAEKGNK